MSRRFEAAIFDWDGTAVPDRQADARAVRRLVERLSAGGFEIGVVSGTHVGNVDGQLAARPSGPGRLYLGLNRGSEVFAVGAEGPELLERREATAAEDAALSEAANRTVERLAEVGLRAEIVSQRLNRRKIDLIPEPEWADPPKARIAELAEAVGARVRRCGLTGLVEVVAIAHAAAVRAGLPDPRVTSDAKHVEIGLTDKSESALWLAAELARRGIDPDALLIGGDEFGSLAGVGGSDSLMLVPELAGATVVSVGVEPGGVPDGVVALGGGPRAFLGLLDDQLRRRRDRELPAFRADPAWSISVAGVDAVSERAQAAVLAIGDGRLGTTASPLLDHPACRRGVFMSGVYDGQGAESHLLAWPAWARLDGELDRPAELVRSLDLRRGLLVERLGTATATSVDSIRFSPLADPGSGVLRAALDDGPPPSGSPLCPPAGRKQWQHGDRGGDAWLETATESGHAAIAGVESSRSGEGHGRTVDRFAAYAASGGDPVGRAIRQARSQRDRGFEALLCEQRAAWGERWEAASVTIDGDPELQLAARLALFHLFASAVPSGESAIGARGLTGPGYRGHVFWDADVFVLPVLAATAPTLARSLLEYRVRRIAAARAEARAAGYRGARFPWESARSGRDVTPDEGRLRTGERIRIRTGELEEHIVADVAWAAAHYLEWTGDVDFARGPGLALLTETARYWAGRIRLDGDGRAHIDRVIGPDEYHEGVDDNAFTNVMARWNLRAAAAAAASADAAIEEAEVGRWLALADALVDGYDPETGLYEQFAGFYGLEPLVIADLAPRRPVAAEALLGLDRVHGAQVVKQADVLMLHHLLPDEVAPGSLRANLDFYEPRTAHGSSLSPGIHASLFARAGRLDRALEALRLTARIDLDDLTETTAAGIHLAALATLWQSLAFGFAGVRPLGADLALDPRLPASWAGLELGVTFRGHKTRVRIGRDELELSAERPMTFRIGPERTPVAVSAAGARLVRAGRDWREEGK